jgi:putative sigma-54 modulation protein
MTETDRAIIEEKIDKLPRYYNSIYDVEVIVEGNKGATVGSVEIIARAKHNNVFVAKHTGEDMYVCIDEAVKKIESQLKKHKEKQRDNKHSGTAAEQN